MYVISTAVSSDQLLRAALFTAPRLANVKTKQVFKANVALLARREGGSGKAISIGLGLVHNFVVKEEVEIVWLKELVKYGIDHMHN